MQRLPVESSDIVAIGYDAPSRTLEVEFHGARIYQYLEVTADIHEQFVKAPSYGTFFYSHVNGRYRYKRIDANEDQAERSKNLAFVTGNARKMQYLYMACEPFGIPIEQLDVPVDEIQSDDAAAIALHKAKAAYKLANRPVLVNDTYWTILALRGFPGAYAHHITQWFKPEDWLALMHGKQDRTVICTGRLVYYDGKRPKEFTRDRYGKIIEESRGGTIGSSLEHVVVMDGFEQTMAEVAETGQPTFKLEASIWHDFAKWYNMQRKLGRV